MVKRHTSLSVDSNLIDQAKEKELNISELTENAIKEKLGQTNVVIEESNTCELCGREEEHASKENDYKGLTWLYPDEIWMCHKCLKEKSKQVPLGLAFQ